MHKPQWFNGIEDPTWLRIDRTYPWQQGKWESSRYPVRILEAYAYKPFLSAYLVGPESEKGEAIQNPLVGQMLSSEP